MKRRTTLHHLAFAAALAGLVLAGASGAEAAPPGKKRPGWQTHRKLDQKRQIEDLKPGDKVAIVCKECETVTTATFSTKEEAMKWCQEGGMVMCESCEKERTVKFVGPPGKKRIVYVNAKGDDCMFITKLSG